MPQRKTHDVYSGNQKVGEVWEHYSAFTEAERAERKAKMMADMIMDDLKKDRLYGDAQYRTKEKKVKKTKNIIGSIFVLASLAWVVINIINDEMISNNPGWLTFVVPAVVFGLGFGILKAMVEPNPKTSKPSIDFEGIRLYWLVGGIVFLILDFAATFGIIALIYN